VAQQYSQFLAEDLKDFKEAIAVNQRACEIYSTLINDMN